MLLLPPPAGLPPQDLLSGSAVLGSVTQAMLWLEAAAASASDLEIKVCLMQTVHMVQSLTVMHVSILQHSPWFAAHTCLPNTSFTPAGSGLVLPHSATPSAASARANGLIMG